METLELVLLVVAGFILFALFYSYRKKKLHSHKEAIQEIRDRIIIAEAQKELAKIRKQSREKPTLEILKRGHDAAKIYGFKVYIIAALCDGPTSVSLMLKNRPRFIDGNYDPFDTNDSRLFLKTITNLEERGEIVNIGDYPCPDTGEQVSFYLSQYQETAKI